MKNKIISAMLVGMSATMAVPVTAVMAAEGEPAATEATAAEAAVTEEVPAEEAPAEEAQAEEAAPEAEAEEAQEEEAVPQVDENGEVTEAAKDAATPADFREKLSTLSFSAEVFGKYADKLTAYATSDAVDKSNLYNCEMSVLDQAERYANGESGEAIKAIKYQIALEFEKVYGEDAFLPGRDIRKAILEDLGKTQDFAVCTTIAEADQLYKDNEGIVTLPVDMIKKDDGDISVNPNPGEGENKPGTGEETGGETKPELDTYVKGIKDYEIKVGEDIDSSSISYDAEKIASVELDTSKVDTSTVGSYVISYIITGVDGSTMTIDKQCVVVENEKLSALRAEMCAKADAMFKDKFTEADFVEEWNDALTDAKANINDMDDQETMQDILTDLESTGQDILNRQNLYIAQTGYIKILNEYYKTLTFATNSQKDMAQQKLDEATDEISSAETIDAASKALEDAKAALKDIAEQKDATIDELKAAAKAEIAEKADAIKDDTSITDNVFDAFVSRIDSCEDAKSIESVRNSADAAFTDTAAAIGGELSAFVNLFRDLKGISPDGDATAMIDAVVTAGAPKNIDEAESKVEDVCAALTNSVDEFIKYLSSRAGQDVPGRTKAEAYAAYVELTGGEPANKELEDAKKASKEEIDKLLATVEDSSDEIKAKKEEVKESAYALIDKSEDQDDLDANFKAAKEAVEAFIKEVQGEGELKDLKEAAKIQIQSVVDDQKDDKLKAILQDIATPALEKIDAAKTQDEITSILETYQKDIQTAIDTYAKDKELAAAQAAAVKKLATLESKAKADYVTEDMKKIITTAKEEIQKAKTVDNVTKLYNQAKSDYNTAYLTSMRAAYEKKLDALLTDNKFTDATYLEKAKEVVTKQKANLKQAANEATMQEVYKVAKENVEKLVTAQSTAANLAQVKTNAIQSLKNGYPNPSSATTKILEKYINKINSATSESEVNDIVQECKDVLKKTGIDYDNNNGGGNNGGGSDVTPTPGIDSNVTPTPSNSATPNGGTTTTLPGGGSSTGTGTGDASQKGTSDVSAAGNVKTGDENMGIIAMAGAAILAAIAAAGISLRKFLKKDE
mgnify:FL=1